MYWNKFKVQKRNKSTEKKLKYGKEIKVWIFFYKMEKNLKYKTELKVLKRIKSKEKK